MEVPNENRTVTFDPTVPTSEGEVCNDGVSPVDRLISSPIFNEFPISFNGVDFGETQWFDAFRRAEYYNLKKLKKKLFPFDASRKQIYLNLLLQPPISMDIPAEYDDNDTNNDDSSSSSLPDHYFPPEIAGSGCSYTVAFDNEYFDDNLRQFISNSDPSKFYLFLTVNSVARISLKGVAGGYHDAFVNNNSDGIVLTYGWSGYLFQPALIPEFEDLLAMSHEIGEWLNDPISPSVNYVHSWGNIGQVGGCYPYLEVGDPLTGTVLEYSDSETTWMFQELAYSDFFFGNPFEAPIGAGGVYSQNGTFYSAAMQCGGGFYPN